MKVSRSDLLEGCILVSDVFSKSVNPIIPKKTTLNQTHIEFLEAFNIEEVEVESVLANGEIFKPRNNNGSKALQDQHKKINNIDTDSNSFIVSEYFNAVNLFKNHFVSWQKGQPFNYLVIKTLLDPLISKFIKEPKTVIRLYHYCQEEDYIYHHSVSVALLSAVMAHRLNYKRNEIYDIALSGLLADSGMAKLPPRLLKKPTGLLESDLKLIRQHPVFGYQMLKADGRIEVGTLLGVLQHHEREDGSGYPLGIKGQKLHPYSKIIALVDTFHAMVCERPYRPKQSLYKVLETLQKDQFGKFDPKIFSCLLNEAIQLSIGVKVRLTNNEVGEIIFIDQNNPTRPVLRINESQTLSLMDNPALYIDDIITY